MKKIIQAIEVAAGLLLLFGFSLAAKPIETTPPQEYKNTIIYIGQQEEEINLGFQQNFDKQKTYLKEIYLSDKKNFSEEETASKISENINDFKTAKTIIINTNNYDVVLQILSKTNKETPLNIKEKDIYLITNSNKFFLKRVLAKYIKNIEVKKIYSIPKDELLNFLYTLSLNKPTNQESYITPFSLTFQETPKLLLISYLVDNLISNGLSIDLIGILLILAVGTLVVSIFRQVIGFSVFGIYSPLLFALAMAVLGVYTSLGILLIGCIAKILTNMFCKKIYLLHNAKTTFLIVLYFLLILIAIGLDSIYNTRLIKLDVFNSIFSLFPIVFIIIVTDKVFNDGFKAFSLGRWFSFGEFLIVSFSVRGLLNRSSLKHIMLSYPELIIMTFILNILIGRFTGLQFLEYFRFMPLIKRHLDGEEEE